MLLGVLTIHGVQVCDTRTQLSSGYIISLGFNCLHYNIRRVEPFIFLCIYRKKYYQSIEKSIVNT